MKVTLERFGGFAAVRRKPLIVDAAKLTAIEAEELARLVADAVAAPPPSESGPGPMRDAMAYTLTIEKAGDPIVVEQSDGAMSSAFSALRQWVERHNAVK